MLEMQFDASDGYITVDTDDWINDRVSGVNEEATASYIVFHHKRSEHDGYMTAYHSAMLLDWLISLGATGIYGEGEPVQICTVNEENFLTDDIIMTFANTEEFGTLFITQDGYMTSATPTIYSFNGDDDSDAFDWARGYANCSNKECKSEWIIENAYTLWNNGGSMSVRISDLELTDDNSPTPDGSEPDPKPICPMCHEGTLTFWSQ